MRYLVKCNCGWEKKYRKEDFVKAAVAMAEHKKGCKEDIKIISKKSFRFDI